MANTYVRKNFIFASFMSDVWFEGPIAEAVSTVTRKNLVFLVFIYGKEK